VEASDLVLYIASKVGTVPGRTSLQKLCYFANFKLGADIPFKPHYYGPYSPQIARATDSLLAFDFVDESRESGTLSSPWTTPGGTVITDWERRSYKLTSEGESYLKKLPRRRREALSKANDLIAKLSAVTKLDAKKLSTLAKVHLIIHQHGQSPKDVDGIMAAAKIEAWRLTRNQVERALKTLSSLPL
jgi:uncharacterized protein